MTRVPLFVQGKNEEKKEEEKEADKKEEEKKEEKKEEDQKEEKKEEKEKEEKVCIIDWEKGFPPCRLLSHTEYKIYVA